MAVYKNVASQKLAVFAYDSTDGSPVTGNAANITAQISLDGAATVATNDVNPTELDATDAPGIYIFDLTQAETNADLIVVAPVSGTADVELDPSIIYTTPGTNAGVLSLLAPVTHTGAAVPTVTNAISLPSIPAGWLTAAGIASNAITADKIASNAITDAKIASNAIAAAKIADNAITAAKINTGAITAAKFAAGAIDAAAIATDAIGADEIAAGAVNKIQAGLATPTNITAGTITTVTNLTNAPTAGDLTATMKASVNTEVDAALADIHLDHLLAADYDPASKPGVATALLNELIENNAGVSRYTAGALAQAPTGGSAPTVGQIADAVWTEVLSPHISAGSAAEALDAAGTAGDPWLTALPGAYGSGTAGKIIGDNLNATVSSRATQTSVDDVPTNAEFNARTLPSADYFVVGDYTVPLTTLGANAPAGWINAAAIAASALDGKGNWNVGKTEYSLSSAGVSAVQSGLSTLSSGDLSSLQTAVLAEIATRASQTSVNTIDGIVDDILVDTNELQTDLANGGRLDLLIDGIKAKTDSMTFTVAGVLDVNLQYLNNIEVIGAGVPTSNPWRPA